MEERPPVEYFTFESFNLCFCVRSRVLCFELTSCDSSVEFCDSLHMNLNDRTSGFAKRMSHSPRIC